MRGGKVLGKLEGKVFEVSEEFLEVSKLRNPKFEMHEKL
jgi:hypothetical protein